MVTRRTLGGGAGRPQPAGAARASAASKQNPAPLLIEAGDYATPATPWFRPLRIVVCPFFPLVPCNRFIVIFAAKSRSKD